MHVHIVQDAQPTINCKLYFSSRSLRNAAQCSNCVVVSCPPRAVYSLFVESVGTGTHPEFITAAEFFQAYGAHLLRCWKKKYQETNLNSFTIHNCTNYDPIVLVVMTHNVLDVWCSITITYYIYIIWNLLGRQELLFNYKNHHFYIMLWYMALVEHLYMIEQSLSNAHVSHNSTYTKKLEFISCFFQNYLLIQKCLNIFKHLH